MKQFKIYGQSYELTEEAENTPDSYAYKGELVDEEPKGKHVGYVTMEDGSIVDCYKSANVLLFVLPAVAVLSALAAVVYFFVLPMFEKEVAIGGTMLETDVGKNVVTFNGIMSCDSGMLDVRFLNGDVPATIQVQGNGVATEAISVEPGEYVEQIPVTLTTDDGVVEVKIRITSNGDAREFNALVEVPDNMTPYDPNEGLHSYFEKELIVDEPVD